MIVYPMGIQIYDQDPFLRSTSKVKLHHTVLLGVGLKELKITLNIVKVGMHSYLPNVQINLRSNFNSKNWSKVKLTCVVFAFSKLKFETEFRYPFKRQECMHIFGAFRAILDLSQTWSNQGLKACTFFQFLRNQM